jgi:glyoxylase-like metal-dependent hydrolase (beta-lactamase superfamily II)/rhodanese-related sulfurtransferase
MVDVASIPTVCAVSLLPLLDDASGLFVLDVREPDEFASWSIPSAINIPLGALPTRTNEIPKHRRVVTVCAKGARAAQGTAVLAEHGIASEVLLGGMEAWGRVYESVEHYFGDTLVVQLRRRGKGCLSYVIGSDTRAIVIDPSTDLVQYLEIAERYGFSITHVLDTHLHADHLSGARELASLTGAELLLNPADPFNYEFTPIVNDLRIEISDALHLTVSAVSTPGHTEGSTVYRLGDVALFTGDTLFLESVGRPDLADHAEAFAHSLFRSLHDVVLPLSDELLVFPAHFGSAVTVRHDELVTKRLGDLRRTLPALAYDETTFVAWAVARVTDRPGNYQEIVRFNAGRSEMSLGELQALELGPNRCAIAS